MLLRGMPVLSYLIERIGMTHCKSHITFIAFLLKRQWKHNFPYSHFIFIAFWLNHQWKHNFPYRLGNHFCNVMEVICWLTSHESLAMASIKNDLLTHESFSHGWLQLKMNARITLPLWWMALAWMPAKYPGSHQLELYSAIKTKDISWENDIILRRKQVKYKYIYSFIFETP